MILEYILVGVIAFSIGNINGKRNKCNHTEKYVVVHKHKKHKYKFGKKFKRKHNHRTHTMNMMCRNNWRW